MHKLEEYSVLWHESEFNEKLNLPFHDQVTHVLFTLPCLMVALKRSNPDALIKKKKVLGVHPGAWRKCISDKATNNGYFSETVIDIKRRANHLRKHHVEGIFLPHARILSMLFEDGLDMVGEKVVFHTTTKQQEKLRTYKPLVGEFMPGIALNWTKEHIDNFGTPPQDYDEEAVAEMEIDF